MKKINQISIWLLVLPIFLFGCINESAKREFKSFEYRGIITKVYQDDKNHGAYTFDIDTKEDKFKVNIELLPYSWEYAEVGDSIIKPKDELRIIIKKKKNGDSKSFYFRF